jgi:RNA polymerase-interacting CarD/CdnL/TRCF family regulator
MKNEWSIGDRVNYPREPSLGAGRITGLVSTTVKETGEQVWSYVAEFKAPPCRPTPQRIGRAGDFQRA